MPRSGGIYSAPPGTNGASGTPISSSAYNAFVADLVTDANAARPLTAGGTGGTSAVAGNDGLNTVGANIASASTTNLATATGVVVNITGTTTITAFGTVAAGAERILIFADALTLTHDDTSLILPGAANITTAAGDVLRIRSLGSGNWRCVGWLRASTMAATLAGTETLTNKTLTQPVLTLEQGASVAPTAEGRIAWDTDDNVLVIGDGADTQIFLPMPASVAAGDIFYATAAKVLARLAKGTAAQQLQMNAGATAPEWSSNSYDGEIITTWTYSSDVSSIDFTGLAAYRRIRMIGQDITLDGAAAVVVRTSTDNGSNFATTSYDAYVGNDASGTAYTGGFGLVDGTDDNIDDFCLDIDLLNANLKTTVSGLSRRTTGFNDGPNKVLGHRAAEVNNALRLTTGGSEKFTGGTVTLLGWRSQ